MLDYTKDVQFIQDYFFNGSIFEYDIRSAGLSILEASHAIPQEKVEEFNQMTKNSRVVAIGMMIRDNPDLQQIISNGLIQARKEFILNNQLEEGDIICIKKDAIFTTRRCKQLHCAGVDFRIKTRWRSYLRFGRVEFLFNDTTRNQINGLGERSIEYHRDGWIKTIMEIISRVSNADGTVRNYTMNFIMKYKSMELDERYYHPLKSDPGGRDEMYNYTNIIIPLMTVLSKVM